MEKRRPPVEVDLDEYAVGIELTNEALRIRQKALDAFEKGRLEQAKDLMARAADLAERGLQVMKEASPRRHVS